MASRSWSAEPQNPAQSSNETHAKKKLDKEGRDNKHRILVFKKWRQWSWPAKIFSLSFLFLGLEIRRKSRTRTRYFSIPWRHSRGCEWSRSVKFYHPHLRCRCGGYGSSRWHWMTKGWCQKNTSVPETHGTPVNKVYMYIIIWVSLTQCFFSTPSFSLVQRTYLIHINKYMYTYWSVVCCK